MEDQKLLWIVFSVVLFAVVVLASVLYFLKPKTTEPALAMATAGPPTGAGIDTYEYVRGTSRVLPMEEQRPGEPELRVVVGEEPVAQGGPAATPPAPATVQPRPADQPKPSAATAAAAAKPAPAQATPRPEKAAQPAAKPAQPARVFWIQTASYKNRTGAESMAAALGEKGITGRIQVSDVAGQPYFRVRVGPYTSREEAEKFLSWIRAVKGLEQSYISAVNRATE